MARPGSKKLSPPEPQAPADVKGLLILDEVAERLARKYPPDWLETHGVRIYHWMLAICFLLGPACALLFRAWWSFVPPLLVPPLFALMPVVTFGRALGGPRWADARAVVDRDHMDLIHLVMHRAAPAMKQEMMRHYPAHSGDRVFEIAALARAG